MKRKQKELEEIKPHTINLLLIGVSFTILGVLGLVFITQMEVQPGWIVDLNEGYRPEYHLLNGTDINNDGTMDIFCFADSGRDESRVTYNTPEFGYIAMVNGKSGGKLWENQYDGPIKRAFRIFDVNSDGYLDFFASKATVEAAWAGDEEAQVIHNNFTNFLLYGNNGTEIPIQYGIDSASFSNYYVMDLVYLEDLEDDREDIICIEHKHKYGDSHNSEMNITSYFINGTKVNSTNFDLQELNFHRIDTLPQIELLSYNGESHLLLVQRDYIQLINLSTSDYSNDIYKAEVNMDRGFDIESYEIIEDLDLNGIPEILVANSSGAMILINGTDGTYLSSYNIERSQSYRSNIMELSNGDGDGTTYIISDVNSESGRYVTVCEVTLISIDPLWTKTIRDSQVGGLPLGADITGDNIGDVVTVDTFQPIGSMNYVRRYSFRNAITGKEKWQMNVDNDLEEGIVSSDIDGDGYNDIVGVSSQEIFAFSVAKPVDLWLSPKYSYGFILFVLCVVFLVIGLILLARYGTKLRFSIRKSVRENKMAFAVTAITIIVMSITLILFLFMINIFNSTLIAEGPMTRIIVAFLTVSIMWYTLLPLTAAIYNQFAPRFAFFFVRLRELFFKISKSYEHDIFILDMGNRKEISNLIKIKRIVLPTMLSITVGFLVYGYAAPLYGYATNFTVFGSTQFFSFMAGYSLFCTFPLILSFSLFSFLIAGNYLLDDAGVAYYRESNKHRSPGDIEPISIWAQSMIKGFAGLSALITFGTFFASVDFSGFFSMEEGNFMFVIFGAFMVFSFFWGNPFITSFSYILLAEEVMELSHNTNVQKFYKIMEKKGYDVKPRKLTQLYPSGIVPSNKANDLDPKLTDNDE